MQVIVSIQDEFLARDQVTDGVLPVVLGVSGQSPSVTLEDMEI